MEKAKPKPTHLFWVDLEMTGLDVEKEVILEVAALVTDFNLNVTSPTYHAIVKQPQKYLDQMDDWNQKHHKESGLLDKLPNGKTPDVVEDELLQFIAKHLPNQKAILSGNSISQDRKFIDKYWGKLAGELHYRMLDVTAWKVIFESRYNLKFKKNDTHRAEDDILESIQELKYYMGYIKA